VTSIPDVGVFRFRKLHVLQNCSFGNVSLSHRSVRVFRDKMNGFYTDCILRSYALALEGKESRHTALSTRIAGYASENWTPGCEFVQG
jgi:hypothetical protein